MHAAKRALRRSGRNDRFPPTGQISGTPGPARVTLAFPQFARRWQLTDDCERLAESRARRGLSASSFRLQRRARTSVPLVVQRMTPHTSLQPRRLPPIPASHASDRTPTRTGEIGLQTPALEMELVGVPLLVQGAVEGRRSVIRPRILRPPDWIAGTGNSSLPRTRSSVSARGWMQVAALNQLDRRPGSQPPPPSRQRCEGRRTAIGVIPARSRTVSAYSRKYASRANSTELVDLGKRFLDRRNRVLHVHDRERR